MRNLTNILVTGGCGFIGSNFIRFLLNSPEFTGRIINLDKLTYAGNPQSLIDIEKQFGGTRYFFEHADITDAVDVNRIFETYNIDTVVHFAAESHVDRSITGPAEFIKTNIQGTFILLEAARKHWIENNTQRDTNTENRQNIRNNFLFHHVSTDEVYGSLGDEGYFSEQTPYDPRSPYSASKASSDHLVRSYYHTYGLPITISNCSNNYGPYQFPEKLIPLMIENMFEEKPLPVYGDGANIRDWLYVEDHNSAVWMVMQKGETGTSYNIGGENEWRNIELVQRLCEITAEETGKTPDHYKKLITFVNDRPGHDRRYAIDCSKIKTELGWKQSVTFDQGLRRTIRWYLENRSWVQNVKSGEYLAWIEKNYKER